MELTSLRNARIIVVEDDFALAQHTRRTLVGLERASIELCHDLASAREAIAGAPFDVVVSDFNLPDGTGADVLHAAREACADAPRILVTAQAEWETAEACVNEGGVFRVLAKPWAPELLLGAVSEAITLKRGRDASRERGAIGARHQLEIAAANARLMSENLELDRFSSESRARILRAFAAAIEVRLGEREPSSVRVARIARRLAASLGLPAPALDAIEEAALLHRIGFAALRDDGERRRAPELGAQIARCAGMSEAVVRTIREQGEGYDGSGERGLDGTSIDVGARVLAVAATYAALTWRDAMPAPSLHAAACGSMLVDRRLDPQLVAMLVSWPSETWSELDPVRQPPHPTEDSGRTGAA